MTNTNDIQTTRPAGLTPAEKLRRAAATVKNMATLCYPHQRQALALEISRDCTNVAAALELGETARALGVQTQWRNPADPPNDNRVVQVFVEGEVVAGFYEAVVGDWAVLRRATHARPTENILAWSELSPAPMPHDMPVPSMPVTLHDGETSQEGTYPPKLKCKNGHDVEIPIDAPVPLIGLRCPVCRDWINAPEPADIPRGEPIPPGVSFAPSVTSLDRLRHVASCVKALWPEGKNEHSPLDVGLGINPEAVNAIVGLGAKVHTHIYDDGMAIDGVDMLVDGVTFRAQLGARPEITPRVKRKKWICPNDSQ
jgi:hypothetical protein